MPKPSYSVLDIDLSTLNPLGELFAVSGSSVEFVKVGGTIEVAFGDSSADLIEISEPQQRSFCKPLDGLFIKSSAGSGTVQILVSDEIEAAVFSAASAGASASGATVQRLLHIIPAQDGNGTHKHASYFGPTNEGAANAVFGILEGNGGTVDTEVEAGTGEFGIILRAGVQGTDYTNARWTAAALGVPVSSFLDKDAVNAPLVAHHFDLRTTIQMDVLAGAVSSDFPIYGMFGFGVLNAELNQNSPPRGAAVCFIAKPDISANWLCRVQSWNAATEVVREEVDTGVPFDGIMADLRIRTGHDGTNPFTEFYIDGVLEATILRQATEFTPQPGLGWPISISVNKRSSVQDARIIALSRYGLTLDHTFGA